MPKFHYSDLVCDDQILSKKVADWVCDSSELRKSQRPFSAQNLVSDLAEVMEFGLRRSNTLCRAYL